MFTQFGATADTLTKASTMVFRIGTDAHLYDDPDDVDIPSLLDSRFDSDKCEALKRLLALIAQGLDVSNFFPQVVKNVASQSLEVKKLAYLYLLHYAEKRPNEALLSINCFQKDLADINPLVRACALRTMAGIRLHVIAPIVLVAVGKCARDSSVYVRKCAANALPKLNDLRLEENVLAIEEIIGLLLNDNSPGVVGAAAAAFNSICPNNLHIIGRNFRRLCEVLPDVEEWGQIILIGILLRYLVARHGLVEDSVMCSLHGTGSIDTESEAINIGSTPKKVGEMIDDASKTELLKLISLSYIESPDEYLSRLSYTNGIYHGLNSASFTPAESNEDVKILLKSTLPLLWSQNSAVVLAAAGVQWIMAPRDDLQKIVKPLLFVLRSSSASKYIVLCNIQVFAKAMPALFSAYYEDFILSASELYQVKALKLEILSFVATESSITHIFEEFRDYIRDPDRRLAADTVAAIGLCAERLPQVANICVEGLLSVIRQEIMTTETRALDGEPGVLIQAVMSLEVIIKQDPQAYEKVIIQLARSLDLIKVPVARAAIIWLVGEYSYLGERFVGAAVVVLKYLIRCFTSEAFETKLQILNASAKVALHAKEDLLIMKQVAGYLLEIAKYDLNYDVRDRARVLKGLITSFWGSDDKESRYTTVTRESACYTVERILGSESFCKYNELVSDRFYLPGSLSQLVLHSAPGYEPLPKPCSLLQTYNVRSFDVVQATALSEDSYESDNATSPSLPNEESLTDYSSRQSSGDSGSVDDGSDSGSETSEDDNLVPLIHLSDAGGDVDRKQSEEVLSKRALETWLAEQNPSEPTSSEGNLVQRSVRISISDLASRVKVKSYTLLDTVSGDGLRVDYSFSSESSDLSPHLVCLEVSFRNCSSEPFTEVILKDEESEMVSDSTKHDSKASDSAVPILVPMEEIEFLEPGQTITRIIQVHFAHHLLPLKLLLWCSGKKFPVKLRPDIGYFVKPLPLDIETFRRKESQLPGMFEYMRRCTFTDHISGLSNDKSDSSSTKDVYLAICESLALKMLSNANLHLVTMEMPVANKLDDASGLCLRFSCEIISSSLPCLITTTVEGSCLEALDLAVKVNCEETVFGLNLMNRIVNFLAEQASPQL